MGSIKIAESDDEIRIYNEMTTYAFMPSPNQTSEDKPEPIGKDYFPNSLRYLYYQDDLAVSSLHSIPMTQNVRGKIFQMQGIAGVSTYPEHRRKGYVKELMHHTLTKGMEEGQIFTTLYPFRQSFYGNYGYVNLPQSRIASFKPEKMRDLKNYNTKGEIYRALLGHQSDRYYTFLSQYESETHGCALFSKESYNRLEKSKSWVAFAVVDGEDRGVMVFSTKGFEKEIIISEFLYQDSNAKYLLLDHISRHIDQFSDVRLRIFGQDRPETWFYDSKVSISSREWVPSAMGRVLDIAKLSGMNVGTGSINIKINDSICSWNNGNWKLTAEENRLQVEPSNDFDIEMSIQGISAIVYGGYDLDDLFFRGWMGSQEHNKTLIEIFPDLLASIFSIF